MLKSYIVFLLLIFLLFITVGCGGSGGDNEGNGRIAESDITSDGLKIYITAGMHISDFANDPYLEGTNAIEKADFFCNQDPNKPDDSTYKALLVDGLNRDAVDKIDWVLRPNTTYYRPYNNVEIGVTTDKAIFGAHFRNLANSICEGGCEWEHGMALVWTGIGDSSDFSSRGESFDGTDPYNAIGGANEVDGKAFFDQFCGSCTIPLYCVEQP